MPAEASAHKPIRGRIILAVLLAPVIGFTTLVASGYRVDSLFAAVASERMGGGACARLDLSKLDPANPAHRACYCAVDARSDVCFKPRAEHY